MKFEGLDEVKQGVAQLRDSVAGGWQKVRQSAAGALTRFRPGEHTDLPERDEIDDGVYLASRGWCMLGGDVFEDEQRLVVRLEIPGMGKDEFAIQVLDDTLVVSGEKRFEREDTKGRYRMLQCAYGVFRRVVPLPVPVLADESRASYRQGVLKIELTKANLGKTNVHTIKVD